MSKAIYYGHLKAVQVMEIVIKITKEKQEVNYWVNRPNVYLTDMLVNEEDLILHKIEANGCSLSYKFSIGEKVICKGEVCEIRGILIVKDVLGNVEVEYLLECSDIIRRQVYRKEWELLKFN